MIVVQPSLAKRCLAEFAGTFILIFLGLGVVHTSVLTGAQSGLWQVAVVWGAAVTLAIYVVGGVSGAHINPAISAALAAWGRFPWREVVPYVLAQTAGAFAAAALLFVLFNPYLKEREREKGVERGGPGSEITAMCYGEFFPSPGPLSNSEGPYSLDEHQRINAFVPESSAFLGEVVGTMLLAMVVVAVTDPRNSERPAAGMAPAFIGLTVAALVSIFGPLTQACFNPARDVGPRLFAMLAGWGTAALPRGTGVVTVYVLAPILGAIIGAGLYDRLLKAPDDEPRTTPDA
ncbi:MIP/aquaporin family protein [Planctomyces sp. SH-PL62]|uniref:MIP/aquaporin family protein n=1 Tax=Planctomyces sp. SH-PL62 TaxID=1636152 RepID=UPI00078B22A5|nr:MIP/aquaporin family protein [Planctomyces sp. SH-PL62]AMV38268.1 Glycerol uptake facilitator protein [Planctomyces sp. SH-PL62]